MPKTFSVYELNGNGWKNYIGSVEADCLESAQCVARMEYGAPIRVRED